MKGVLGILGGMGPLASAEFLKTIYEFNVSDPEQKSPRCILYSDPELPDRTEAILNGSGDIFVTLLSEALENLCWLGATKIVISCITSHFFLPEIRPQLRDKVISLIDLTVDEIWSTKRRYLMLCSNGTSKVRLFQKHKRWNQVEQYVVTPSERDQNMVHDIIYQIKRNSICDAVTSALDCLLRRYRVDSFIAGCTEIHLLTKRLMNGKARDQACLIIDPLLIVARNVNVLIT
jgi:aspartate racemase